MRVKTFTLIVLFISFFVFSCAGTKKNSDSATDTQATQQQDLNDIEALLGIDTNSKPAPKTKKKKSGEKLSLLNENEVANPDQNKAASTGLTSSERRQYEKRIQNLQKQLRDKDQIIQQLREELNQQSLEISKLRSQKGATSTVATGGNTPSIAPVSGVSKVPSSEYEATYQQAREAFEARDYNTALNLFQSLIASNPNHPLADNAQYWIGECHYALRKYDAAIIDFQKVFTFPNSNKLADAQFKLVLCYLKKGEPEKAREEFQRLQTEFPNSPYVQRAQAILAKY
jgi:tol-pal system protein YbgF